MHHRHCVRFDSYVSLVYIEMRGTFVLASCTHIKCCLGLVCMCVCTLNHLMQGQWVNINILQTLVTGGFMVIVDDSCSHMVCSRCSVHRTRGRVCLSGLLLLKARVELFTKEAPSSWTCSSVLTTRLFLHSWCSSRGSTTATSMHRYSTII